MEVKKSRPTSLFFVIGILFMLTQGITAQTITAAFGKITNTINESRRVEFVLKYYLY